MAIIEVKAVNKGYGKHQVLRDVSFSIEEPGIVALVGPNGSGKSTLMNLMMNLLDLDAGEIKLLGKSNKDVSIFKEVAFLKDNTILYPYLTGWDHLSYAARTYGLSKERVWEVSHQLGIEGYVKQKTGRYSLGMKQHLLLALAILNEPSILVLDEPLNGLDPTSILKTRQLIRELGASGKTVLMSSHTLSEVDAVTSHILFLKDGMIREERLDVAELSLRKTAEQRYLELYRDEVQS